MKISIHKETNILRSIRVRQLESLFDVPAKERLTFDLEADLPVEDRVWKIGLIVGPSGSGKTLTLAETFGRPPELSWWKQSSVIDSVQTSSVDWITEAFQAVGFNTVPNWMRPFETLSNGEQFRVNLARVMVEGRELCKGATPYTASSEVNPFAVIKMDEFTSVVDRQVAKIGAYAVNKYIRKHGLRFVAASCHYDVIDWLQPDWIFEPASGKFQWRELQCPPELNITIGRVPYSVWRYFARFHYKTEELNKAARCFALCVDGHLASFCAVLHRPHPRVRDIIGATRAVTLPDWQGLGLAMILADNLGAAYTSIGKRFRKYPNHPTWARSHLSSPNWKLVKAQGDYSPRRGESSTVGGFGGSTCAVFEYVGKAMDVGDAKKVLEII